MPVTQRKVLMNAYFLSQFGNCPLVWMTHSRILNIISRDYTKEQEHSNFSELFNSETSKHCTKTKFSIKDFFSKCDQIRRKLRIWSHLLKKSLMKNFIFCVVKRNVVNSFLTNVSFLHTLKMSGNYWPQYRYFQK